MADTESCISPGEVNAASFLNDAAKTVENDARESLQEAASIYGNEAKLLGSVFSTRDAFLGP